MPVEVDFAGEGRSDQAIARTLIKAVGLTPGISFNRSSGGTGKVSLDRRLAGFNAGVRYGRPMLVLRDLDQDENCAGVLVARLLPDREQRLLLRICVRQAETWLMADFEAYAKYCGIPRRKLQLDLETLSDPKRRIADLASATPTSKLFRRLSEARRRSVADWASLGAWHADFATDVWNPVRASASGRVPSLDRALVRLRALTSEGNR